eukprot:347005-Pelagomonas_calceolata.AAC.1
MFHQQPISRSSGCRPTPPCNPCNPSTRRALEKTSLNSHHQDQGMHGASAPGWLTWSSDWSGYWQIFCCPRRQTLSSFLAYLLTLMFLFKCVWIVALPPLFCPKQLEEPFTPLNVNVDVIVNSQHMQSGAS